ncbi:polysaccharide deacetylase family protein [Tissierella praeacuta]|uniref:polysaccharide deacetylase family protein n=1 Tax=Tissierella praeacuta TaxID=43131 RepID=UPI001C119261|nr:polysaccharide deacetylase family protein [Tissierella praeacuta]MBU5257024.1 polysaccharide deacetylase [Tissierella praeacuta]
MKRKKIFLAAIILFLIGGTSARFFFNSTNTVVAVSVVDTLDIMGEKNPINRALYQEIRQIKEERFKAEMEAKRMEEEKLAEEKVKNGKIAYLTFDDGPSKQSTPAILDILSEYDIKATFFVLGRMAKLNPDMIKRINEEGHSIGHHSYSHNYGYIYKNTNNFLGELKLTEKVLKDTLGEDFETKLLRLPGGSFEKHKQKFLKVTGDLGYKNYNWNALNGDAEGVNIPKNKLVNRLKSTAKGKKEIIVLMHDTDAKKTTVEALPEIIDYLIKEGYEFRALDQY